MSKNHQNIEDQDKNSCKVYSTQRNNSSSHRSPLSSDNFPNYEYTTISLRGEDDDDQVEIPRDIARNDNQYEYVATGISPENKKDEYGRSFSSPEPPRFRLFPSSVCVTFFSLSPTSLESSDSLKVPKNYYYLSYWFRLIIAIFGITFLIAIIANHPIHRSDRWCYEEPDIPWNGQKTFTFKPETYKNFELDIKGHSSHGRVLISQSTKVENVTINTEILLSNPYLQDMVKVVAYDDPVSEKYILLINTPGYGIDCGCILVNVNITFPQSVKEFGDLIVDVFNTEITTDDMVGIVFEKVEWQASSPLVEAQNLQAHRVNLYTTGPISGSYAISDSLAFHTTNAKIDTTVKQLLFLNTKQGPIKSISLETSNSPLSGVYPYSKSFEARSTNGAINVNIAEGEEDFEDKDETPSKIILDTSNGSIEGSYFVDGEWYASTSNGPIKVDIDVPEEIKESLRITGQTSNGKITMDMSDAYQGRFHLATSNGNTKIKEGSDIEYTIETPQIKSGYKGDLSKRTNELALFSSNGRVKLSFY
ncbi:hypothetical protein G9A89_019049 [Geosiphon pyriformis]|nr:hypothetical protein G9A89_019049 [Geosiphon pyriformis]